MPPRRGGRPQTLTITFKKSTISGRYLVYVNGRPAGQVDKEDNTKKLLWIYTCKKPVLHGVEKTRDGAVRWAIIKVLNQSSDVVDYFAL